MKRIKIARVFSVTTFAVLAISGIILNLKRWQFEGFESFFIFPIGAFFKELIITLGPELGGIAFGVVTLDYLNERRQRQAESFRRNRQLLREFASAVPYVAVKAAEDLMEENELASGLMREKIFNGANLSGAKLMKADFTGSSFRNATLTEADLEKAILVDTTLTYVNLDKANLSKCNLEEADLEGSSLKQANLRGVNAQKAFLNKTNLKGANLYGANLKGAFLDEANLKGTNLEFSFLHETSLRNAIYDQSTVWPDKFVPEEFGAINKDKGQNLDTDLKDKTDE